LSELQRLLLSDARAGSLDPALLKTALNGIAAIADEHGLTLPLVINT
jgi:ABC-type methionine transport system ATPase subunit